MTHRFIDVTMTSPGNKPQLNVFLRPPPPPPAEAPRLPAASTKHGNILLEEGLREIFGLKKEGVAGG